MVREARVPSVQKGKSNGVVLLDKFVFQLPIMFMFPNNTEGRLVSCRKEVSDVPREERLQVDCRGDRKTRPPLGEKSLNEV